MHTNKHTPMNTHEAERVEGNKKQCGKCAESDKRREREREESLDPMLETRRINSGPLISAGRQRYFITQVRNYLPLVKNSDIRGKLKLFIKYLFL